MATGKRRLQRQEATQCRNGEWRAEDDGIWKDGEEDTGARKSGCRSGGYLGTCLPLRNASMDRGGGYLARYIGLLACPSCLARLLPGGELVQ